MKKKSLNRERAHEAAVAYGMVLPALIVIFAIALYPVLRSFYTSLFDLRLNHPTRNSINLSYQLDLSKYIDTEFYVNKVFKELENSTAGKKAPEKVASIKTEILSLKEDLMKIDSVSTRYAAVEKIVQSMKPVTDPELKFAKLSKKQAEDFRGKVAKARNELSALSTKKGDAAEQASNMMEELTTSIMDPNFVGLGNMKYFLGELTVQAGELGRLGKSLLNTVYITFSSVFLELLLGLMIALLINRPYRGRALTRAAVLVPWAIPTVASARMWAFLYDGQTGIVAHWLAQLHIIKDSGVLLTTKFGAFCAVVAADVWKTTPYMALLILAGLMTISEDLFEAADIDGATKIQQFFTITLPLLKPTIVVALLFRTLDAFRIFDLIYVLTGGGPGNSTESISMYAYTTMFSQMDFGKGSTLSIIVFICITLISILYIKVLGADVMQDHGK